MQILNSGPARILIVVVWSFDKLLHFYGLSFFELYALPLIRNEQYHETDDLTEQ